ncbi:hypothetical protein ACFL52_03580 [Candidatus Margulisiibacteriota bacterium]
MLKVNFNKFAHFSPARIQMLWQNNRYPKARERMCNNVVLKVLTGQAGDLHPEARPVIQEVENTFIGMINRTKIFLAATRHIDKSICNDLFDLNHESSESCEVAFSNLIAAQTILNLSGCESKGYIEIRPGRIERALQHIESLNSNVTAILVDKIIDLAEVNRESYSTWKKREAHHECVFNIVKGLVKISKYEKAIEIGLNHDDYHSSIKKHIINELLNSNTEIKSMLDLIDGISSDSSKSGYLICASNLLIDRGNIENAKIIADKIEGGWSRDKIQERINELESKKEKEWPFPKHAITTGMTQADSQKIFSPLEEKAAYLQGLIQKGDLDAASKGISQFRNYQGYAYKIQLVHEFINSCLQRREFQKIVDLFCLLSADNLLDDQIVSVKDMLANSEIEKAFDIAIKIDNPKIKAHAMLRILLSLFTIDPRVARKERIDLVEGVAKERDIYKNGRVLKKQELETGLSREVIVMGNDLKKKYEKYKRFKKRMEVYKKELGQIEQYEDNYNRDYYNELTDIFERFINGRQISDSSWNHRDVKKIFRGESTQVGKYGNVCEYAALALVHLKNDNLEMASRYFGKVVKNIDERCSENRMQFYFLTFNQIEENVKSNNERIKKEYNAFKVAVKASKSLIMGKTKKSVTTLLLDQKDQVLQLLELLPPQNAAALLKRVLKKKPKLIKEQYDAIKSLIDKLSLPITNRFLDGIKELLKKQEYEEMVQKIVANPSLKNKELITYLNQSKSDPRLKNVLIAALEEDYPGDIDEGINLQKKIVKHLAEIDKEAADQELVKLLNIDPCWIKPMRNIAQEHALRQSNIFYTKFKYMFLNDLQIKDGQARKELWEEWGRFFKDELNSSDLKPVVNKILTTIKNESIEHAGIILAVNGQFKDAILDKQTEEILEWFKAGYQGIEKSDVNWDIAKKAIYDPHESYELRAREYVKSNGQSPQIYDRIISDIKKAKLMTDETGIDFAAAFYLRQGIRSVFKDDFSGAIQFARRILRSIPKYESFERLSSKFPAIPIVALPFCLSYKNNCFYSDRMLGIFNTIFSAKKIKSSINKKRAIMQSLFNIHQKGDSGNKEAVTNMLLLIEKDFSKSQQNSFVESLQHIESISSFGDMIEIVKETIKENRVEVEVDENEYYEEDYDEWEDE